ncbi:MAG: hypothetical protein U0228_25015 [Myxococcaceae bacterium]
MVTLRDEAGAFEVTVLEAPDPKCVALFAAGRGGDPARHRGLLEALQASGALVIAPHVEFLSDPRPSADHLQTRARRLALAVERCGGPGLRVHGVGHSIGGTVLLALAGAQAWLSAEQPLAMPRLAALSSMTLLAPALGFFQAPAAFAAVTATVSLWWGTADAVCPRAHVDLAIAQLGSRAKLRVAEGADHFSFMHTRPPNAPEPLPDRERFLAELTASVISDAARGLLTAPVVADAVGG